MMTAQDGVLNLGLVPSVTLVLMLLMKRTAFILWPVPLLAVLALFLLGRRRQRSPARRVPRWFLVLWLITVITVNLLALVLLVHGPG